MQPLSFSARIRAIVGNLEDDLFTVQDIVDRLKADGVSFNLNTLWVLISRDLRRQGILEATEKRRGRRRLYRRLAEGIKTTKTDSPPEEKRINILLRVIKEDFVDREFTTDDLCAGFAKRGHEANKAGITTQLTRDLKRQGYVRKVGNRGRRSLFVYNGGLAKKAGRKPKAQPAPATRRKNRPIVNLDMIPDRRTERDALKSVVDMQSHVKDKILVLVLARKGKPFSVYDIIDDLKDFGVDFNVVSARTHVSGRLLRNGTIVRVGYRGKAALYVQQGYESEKDAAPAAASVKNVEKQKPRPDVDVDDLNDVSQTEAAKKFKSINPYDGTFSLFFVAVAAGLEKFSLEYICHELKKIGPWTKKKGKKKCRGAITRLKGRDLIKSDPNFRPTVYQMKPDFYQYNQAIKGRLINAAPELKAKIESSFAKHCQTVEPLEPAPAETIVAPAESPHINEKPVADFDRRLSKIHQALDTLKPYVSDDNQTGPLKAEIERLTDRLSDRNIAMIGLNNRLADAKGENRKLLQRIQRLEQIVDEKNRVNVVLQKRLNDAEDKLRQRRQSKTGTFSMSEMISDRGNQIERA